VVKSQKTFRGWSDLPEHSPKRHPTPAFCGKDKRLPEGSIAISVLLPPFLPANHASPARVFAIVEKLLVNGFE
jgi:hypothetical protein